MKMVAPHGAWCPFCASFFPERGQIPLEHDRWLERQTASFIWSGSPMIIMKAIVMMMMIFVFFVFDSYFQGPVAVLQVLNKKNVGFNDQLTRWSVCSELVNVCTAFLSISHNRWSSPSSWHSYPQEWLCPNNSGKLDKAHKWPVNKWWVFTKPQMINTNDITRSVAK